MEEIKKLLEAKQFKQLRKYLSEMNIADIAEILDELEDEEMLKLFRILPKDQCQCGNAKGY